MRLLAALAAALVVAAPAAAVGGARVRLTDRDPATVVGTGFHPAERVRVTAATDELVLSKTVRAADTGRFVARWARVLPAGCGSTTVVAAGSAGSRAVFKSPIRECSPPQPVDR